MEPPRFGPELDFKTPSSTNWPIYAGFGFIIALVILVTWYIGLSPAAREAREFLSTMPENRIVEIRLEPTSAGSPGAARTVHITDRKRIAEIAAAFRQATSQSPNHPVTQWSVTVRILTAEREYGGQLSQTENQGVMFWHNSKVTSGWSYGTFRIDALGPVVLGILLEKGEAE